MNNRERFLKTMRFETVDHPPLVLPDPWPATISRWKTEGMLVDVDMYGFFGLPKSNLTPIGIETVFDPPFEEVIT